MNKTEDGRQKTGDGSVKAEWGRKTEEGKLKLAVAVFSRSRRKWKLSSHCVL